MRFRYFITAIAVAGLAVATGCDTTPLSITDDVIVRQSSVDPALAPLGEALFNDTRLSLNGNQSCRTCHEPSEGFAAPLTSVTTLGSVVQGSVAGRFGDRKPPSAAYATIAPLFSGGNNPTGGVFWDGRATGLLLGNPAADQALGPFLNPAEQALPDKACVVYRVSQDGYYAAQFASLFGPGSLDIVFPADTEAKCTDPTLPVGEHVTLTAAERSLVETAYNNVARAIAAFEATFNRYSSDHDRGVLSALEQQGLKLFNSKGKCSQCHTSKGQRAAFTDFAFHNLGVPKNPANPVYGLASTGFDPGLGGFTGRAAHLGKFRTPTARNVGMGENRTFMHNGALVSLKQVVDFYNTRDALPRCTDPAILGDPSTWGSFGSGRCWPAPEHVANMDSKQMGKLGLSNAEVDAIVAFMMALTDR
jgi:cytochrome c peroxidase